MTAPTYRLDVLPDWPIPCDLTSDELVAECGGWRRRGRWIPEHRKPAEQRDAWIMLLLASGRCAIAPSTPAYRVEYLERFRDAFNALA